MQRKPGHAKFNATFFSPVNEYPVTLEKESQGHAKFNAKFFLPVNEYPVTLEQ